MPAGSKPGERRGGRKKGTPNKITANARQALEMAFDGIGGVNALQAWAKDNQSDFYKIWSKILPKDVVHSGDKENPIKFERIEINLVKPKN